MTTNKIHRIAVLGAIVALLAFSPAVAAAGSQDVGHFRTKISPHVAGVFINGNYHGTAAMFSHSGSAIALAPGTYDVEIVDPRYQTIKARVTIEAGKQSVLRQTMKPVAFQSEGPYGELITEGFGNSAVYLNGRYYGNTAEFATGGQSLLLAPGDYQMKIASTDGGTLKDETVRITADETLVIYKNGAPARRR